MNDLICPKCKSKTEDGSNFCEICGSPLDPACENLTDKEWEDLMLELEKAKLENAESIAAEMKAKQRYESISEISYTEQNKIPCEKINYSEYHDFVSENQVHDKGISKKEKQKGLIPVVVGLASIAVIAVSICFLFAFGVFDPFVDKKDPSENVISKPEAVPNEDTVIVDETWAENYYADVVSKLAFSNYASVAFDTDMAVGLFNSTDSDIINDMIALRSVVSAYDYVIGSESDPYTTYYDLDSLLLEEALGDNEKRLLSSFFGEGTFVEKYSTDYVQQALDFFYGKDTFIVQDLANKSNFVLSENGKNLYAQTGGIGLHVSTMFYKLREVEYHDNTAVLTLNILNSPDDICLYDYTTGFEITQNNQVETYDVDNETAFNSLCQENNIDDEALGTIDLEILHDATGIHIKVS